MDDLSWAVLGTVAGGAAFVTIVVGVIKDVFALVGRAVKVAALLLSLIVGVGVALKTGTDVWLGLGSGFVIAAASLGIYNGSRRTRSLPGL